MNKKILFALGGIVIIVGIYLLLNGLSLLLQHIGSFTFQEAGLIRILASIPFLIIGSVIILIGYLRNKGKNS